MAQLFKTDPAFFHTVYGFTCQICGRVSRRKYCNAVSNAVSVKRRCLVFVVMRCDRCNGILRFHKTIQQQFRRI